MYNYWQLFGYLFENFMMRNYVWLSDCLVSAICTFYCNGNGVCTCILRDKC